MSIIIMRCFILNRLFIITTAATITALVIILKLIERVNNDKIIDVSIKLIA